MRPLRTWKKVFENDLPNIIEELKEVVSIPAVIILSGPVGAGKTTFTKYFVGDSERVTSPTYSLINETGKVAHADFYRLESAQELVHLELDFYLEDKDYFLVEWGAPFKSELQKMLSEDYMYYDLEIGVNEAQNSKENLVSRNLELYAPELF